jgi:hypothetical protein
MKTKTVFLLSILTGILNFGTLKGQEVSKLMLVKSYFNELDSLCTLDNGDLWGLNLFGATMVIFQESRLIIANEPDNDGELTPKNGLYIGKLADNINIANTSFEWNGKSWTMVNWDALSENDKYSRDKLLIHESWHRNQKKIGIKPVMTENTHLDQLQGGLLLKLEFLALANALNAKQTDVAKKHLTNGLTIRTYRQLLFPGNNENIFELHEGMAEYTGFKLCGIDKKLLPKIVATQLGLSMDKEGLANSFPYLTGPAYGLLFDELKNNWLNDVKKGKSLPEIGSQVIDNKISSDTILLKNEVAKIIDQYGADSFVKRETEKFEYQKQLIIEYKRKFLEKDVLIIKNNNLQMSFNPQEKLTSIGEGVIYKTMRLTGEWGIAEVKNGILRSNDWQFFILPAPNSKKAGEIREVDYNLFLNDDWSVTMIKEGKYTIKKN